MLAEDDQVEQGVGAQAVGAVDRDAGHLPGRIQAGHDGVLLVDHHLAEFVGGDAAHGVVGGGLDRHHLGDRVHPQVDPAEVHDVGHPLEDVAIRERVRGAIRVAAAVAAA